MHDLITTALYYNYDEKKLTEKGLKLIKQIIQGYIAISLDMGHNIANQSVENLKDSDYELIRNNLAKAGSKYKWK